MKPCNLVVLTFAWAFVGYAQEPAAPGGAPGAKYGEDFVGRTVAATRSKDAEVRRKATDALGDFGDEVMHLVVDYTKLLNDEIVPCLEERLKDTDDGVRGAAVNWLRRIGPLAKAAVPALTKVVKDDEDEDIRRSAADALGNMGADAKPAVPAIIELLKDGKADSITHAVAAEALGRIGPGAKSAVPALVASLKRGRMCSRTPPGPSGTSALAPDRGASAHRITKGRRPIRSRRSRGQSRGIRR